MAKALDNVRHDYLRYANCWEDADVLLQALEVQKGDRVLSIASAGDNSLSMLCSDPQLVVAVDINPAQLHLVHLKIASFKALNYEEMLAFLGFKKSSRRLEIFQKLKVELPLECARYWEDRQESLQAGIIYQGKFERYFKIFRTKILPFIHSKAKIQTLFKTKSAQEQQEFCERTWFKWSWVFLFKLFFSRPVMGALGRDPKFLNEVEVRVSEFILSKAKRHLSSVHCQTNYFLQFILLGHFQSQVPHYARPENFELIKSRLDRLQVFQGLAEDAFQKYPDFNKFNLSNIFEYMNPGLFREVSESMVEHCQPPARFAYWNLMVPRKMHEVHQNLEADPDYGKGLAEDCGFFYLDFNLSHCHGK